MTTYASPLPPDYGYGTPPRCVNGPAIASLILGLLGCIPLFAGAAAIVLGLIGVRKSKEPDTGGKGMAVAGLILGITSIVGWGGLASVLGYAYEQSKPAGVVAKQFLADVSAGNFNAAIANSAGFTPAQLQNENRKLAAFGALQSVSISTFSLSSKNGRSTMQLTGIATYATGSKTCVIDLMKSAGMYKVTSFTVQ